MTVKALKIGPLSTYVTKNAKFAFLFVFPNSKGNAYF
jgi:hypothetical protein